MDANVAKSEDLDVICALGEELFPGHFYRSSTIRQIHFLFPSLFIVGRENGEPAGISLGVLAEDRTGHILAMGVKSKFQGQGFGKQLLDSQLTAFERKGISVVSLTVAPENRIAKRLYLSRGFVVVKLLQDFLGCGRHRELMMRKSGL